MGLRLETVSSDVEARLKSYHARSAAFLSHKPVHSLLRKECLTGVSGGNNLHLTGGNVVLFLFCCMSARKVESPGSLQQHVTVEARQSRLSLSSDSVIISKHGIEFRSTTAFSPWTEMTMTLQSPQDGGRVHCNGVVISCSGNRHTGYHVSMVFTNLSKQAEERLSLLAFSQLS